VTEEQIKHMVNRFLGWRLPENFHPDCGIHFDADEYVKLNPRNARLAPNGTNLFDYTQAVAMVRHMLEGMPDGLCPKCGGTHSDRYEGVCAGPPTPIAPPPHKMQG
jgi:hypothetical protein